MYYFRFLRAVGLAMIPTLLGRGDARQSSTEVPSKHYKGNHDECYTRLALVERKRRINKSAV